MKKLPVRTLLGRSAAPSSSGGWKFGWPATTRQTQNTDPRTFHPDQEKHGSGAYGLLVSRHGW